MDTNVSLNPFEIRAGLRDRAVHPRQSVRSLNPFEIRAGLRALINSVVAAAAS